MDLEPAITKYRRLHARHAERRAALRPMHDQALEAMHRTQRAERECARITGDPNVQRTPRASAALVRDAERRVLDARRERDEVRARIAELEERARPLGQLVESCRRALADRGVSIDPDGRVVDAPAQEVA